MRLDHLLSKEELRPEGLSKISKEIETQHDCRRGNDVKRHTKSRKATRKHGKTRFTSLLSY